MDCYEKIENYTTGETTLPDIPDFSQQVDYLVHVINTECKGIKTQTDPSSAAWWWMTKYERPVVNTDRWKAHGKIVTKYYKNIPYYLEII